MKRKKPGILHPCLHHHLSEVQHTCMHVATVPHSMQYVHMAHGLQAQAPAPTCQQGL